MGELFLHGHALLIGVGADLPETVADATALHDVFVDPKRAAYPQAQVDLLVQGKATRENILNTFDAFIARVNADPNATALVYYSGHGGEYKRTSQGTEYFLVPFGYDPAQFKTTAVSGIEFTNKIQALTAKKVIVVLDCCHAAGMPAEKGLDQSFVKSAAPPTLLQAMEHGSGRVVVASSRSDEVSFGGNPNSIFTACLLEALTGQAARDADGYARILDVLSYLFAQVPQRAPKQQQHPFVNKIAELSDNFALCYYAGGSKSAPGVPLTALAPPSYSAWDKYKLEGERDSLLPAYNIRRKKIAFLEKDAAIVAGGAYKFQIEEELLAEQTQVAQMQKRLDEINAALQKLGN